MASDATRHRARILCATAVILNCLTAGSIFTFPLFAPPLARTLGLTGAQTNALASASILGEYVSAGVFGALTDRKGPGATSFAAACLFGLGYGLLGSRYLVSAKMAREGIELPQGQWIFLCAYYFLAGAGTAASYFSAIIAATKSTPSRHSGLAIGLPCSIFGLSPLFLSTLAPYFTSRASELTRVKGVNEELDPGKWLLFLAGFLFLVNLYSSFTLKEIPCEEVVDLAVQDSGTGSIEEDSGNTPSEHTRLLPSTVLDLVRNDEDDKAPMRQSFGTLLSTPTFWLFGAVIFLATGPCEMVMASLGGIVESLLGVHTLGEGSSSSSSSKASTILVALVSSLALQGASDTRALALRRLHVQILSAANTISRLLIGFLSDWLSYAAAPLVADENSPPGSPRPASSIHPRSWKRRIQLLFHDRPPPRVSRLFFLVLSCVVLALSFFYASSSLSEPSGLWILTISVGSCYGLVFTLAPAIVRAVYPISDFGRNWGVLSLFSACGASLFTPLFGVLLDLQREKEGIAVCVGRECFEKIFVLSGVSEVLALAITFVLWKGWWKGIV
ncbi:BZ3500_MvSof-1268-A1-R1_Chr6-3g08689 [Microbotryum saponariae]|uniref:BZ3500_MvSof-1268-A1-R1_Chr6-3g08689 protein n=1 Tax=Microbotryum saponariae TaxID=289078 RepID=A0A2X0MH18_9BASI|nr:BZ3500_MvSof-1268-A1-R1_Chr6-3g08689 [Microbotryum saponariae]SDA07290.1 BZ3501_MvSof-1269-A2-R1_Chr6-2g08392 [Microbotryum saponariae]